MIQLTSHEINISLLTLGGLVLELGLFSGFLKVRLWLSDLLPALVVGIFLGSAALGCLDLAHWGNPERILEQGARLGDRYSSHGSGITGDQSSLLQAATYPGCITRAIDVTRVASETRSTLVPHAGCNKQVNAFTDT